MKHQDVQELLPWYANATLSAEERHAVEEHLAGCAECAHALEGLTALHHIMEEIDSGVPAPSPLQVHRVLARIEESTRADVSAGGRAGGWSAIFRGGWWRSTPLFSRTLVAAQAVLLLALGAALLYQNTHRATSPESGTASGPTHARGGARIVILFQPDVPERELRQTLNDIDGEIVGGPSALGAYTVQLKIPRDQTDKIDRLLDTLRQKRTVIAAAQPAE